MPADLDYYKTLGVERSASQDEIRKAYRKLAKKYHPDRDATAADKFKEVQEAYDVLSDPAKRKQYDQFGHAFKSGAGGPGSQGTPFNWGGGGGGGGGGSEGFDPNNPFGGLDLGDILGGFGRGGRTRGPRIRPGADVQADLEIPFEIAALGGKQDLVFRGEELTVKISAGVDTGTVIRLAGQGEPGIGPGAPPGDLHVRLVVAPHRYFRREGRNLLIDLPLTITEAALGAKVDVPTLDEGQVTLTIPPGTSSGSKLRLRGKGIPDLAGGQRGDQFALIKIIVPPKPNDKVRKLLEELGEAAHQEPRKGLW